MAQNANVTTNGGSVSAAVQTGDISMAAGTTTSTGGGSIGYSASGNVVLSSLNAGSGAIGLSSGGNIQPAAGSTGANLTGGSAVITAADDVTLSTQVTQPVVVTSGNIYSITNVLTGTVMTNLNEWIGGSGNWATALDWSLGHVPLATEVVEIDVPGTATVTVSGGTRSALKLISDDSFVISGGSLDLSGNSQFNGALTLTGGSLTGTGDVTVNGAFNWTGGTLSGAGTLNTASTAMATLSPISTNLRLDRNWTNSGEIDWEGSANHSLAIGSGATLTNAAGGTVVLAAATGSNIKGKGTFQNNGALAMDGTGVTVISAAFDNAGTVNVNSGTLSLSGSGSGSDSGNYSIGSGATLQQTAGTRSVGGTVSGDTLVLAGGTLNLNGRHDAE